MLFGSYRPWGMLPWLLNRLSAKKWDLLGALATGDRSLATWKYLKQKSFLKHLELLQIEDLPSPFWGSEATDRVSARRDEFIREGGDPAFVSSYNILEPAGVINDIANNFINKSADNIIIDISSLPKRYFFPLIKVVLDKSASANIIVCYTRPLSHDRQKPLAIDPQPWINFTHFPLPYPEPKKKQLIVGLGYEPLGLPQLIKGEEFRGSDIRLMFPFPANPEGYLRNWEFVRNLDSDVGPYLHQPIRVDAYDVPSIFDNIKSMTDNCNQYAVFAPYGTKTMSLAMCLYAIAYPDKSSVFYTQPKSYNPNYSTGVKTIRGLPAIFGYFVRMNGKNIY